MADRLVDFQTAATAHHAAASPPAAPAHAPAARRTRPWLVRAKVRCSYSVANFKLFTQAVQVAVSTHSRLLVERQSAYLGSVLHTTLDHNAEPPLSAAECDAFDAEMHV